MVRLPTSDDLKMLTRRAIVAYAVRCAERVRPLSPRADHEFQEAADRAIRTAKEFTSGVDQVHVIDLVDAAETARTVANVVDSKPFATGATAASVTAIVAAIVAAADTAVCATAGKIFAAKEASKASIHSIRAADAVAPITGGHAMMVAMYRDYLILTSLTEGFPQEETKLGEPIDFRDLGVLWPDGEPSWLGVVF